MSPSRSGGRRCLGAGEPAGLPEDQEVVRCSTVRGPPSSTAGSAETSTHARPGGAAWHGPLPRQPRDVHLSDQRVDDLGRSADRGSLAARVVCTLTFSSGQRRATWPCSSCVQPYAAQREPAGSRTSRAAVLGSLSRLRLNGVLQSGYGCVSVAPRVGTAVSTDRHEQPTRRTCDGSVNRQVRCGARQGLAPRCPAPARRASGMLAMRKGLDRWGAVMRASPRTYLAVSVLGARRACGPLPHVGLRTNAARGGRPRSLKEEPWRISAASASRATGTGGSAGAPCCGPAARRRPGSSCSAGRSRRRRRRPSRATRSAWASRRAIRRRRGSCYGRAWPPRR